MTPLRVLFAGTPDVALPALDLLMSDDRFDIVAVLTNPDRPRGRSRRPEPSPVALRARELGLELLQPQRPGDAAERIAATGAQVGAVVAYGALLPERVLQSLPMGFVNLHFSVLPRWRGAAPVQHAIRAGDTTVGVSVFQLDEGMDTGPVLRILELPMPSDIDAGDLLDMLAVAGAPLLAEGLLGLAAGEQAQPQSASGATLAPKLGPADAAVDWTLPAEQVARIVRSVTPRPGARTTLGSETIKVAGVRVTDIADASDTRALAASRDDGDDLEGGDLGPGTIVADEQGIVVTCGSGHVRIGRVQFPGRPWTGTADQVRGRRLASGMVLGGRPGAI
jgi:methionyl-tRNA formyltransferase